MKRALTIALAAAALVAGGANAATFTVVPDDAAALPSWRLPNAPGAIIEPAQISTPPAGRQVLTYEQFLELWRAAGGTYDIPWEVLASIMQIESSFGQDMGPSSAGAVGWMQFLPSTWHDWGVDGNGDGIADPWNATDAVYSAARYLAASGAHEDLPRAVFSYNHSQDYVDAVLAGAARFAADPLGAGFGLLALQPEGPTPEELEAQLAGARDTVATIAARITELEAGLERGGWDLVAAEQTVRDAATQAGDAFDRARAQLETLTGEQAALGEQLALAGEELAQAAAEVTRLEQELALAHAQLGSGSLDGLLPPAPTEAAQRVVDHALAQIGVPYRWGGNHGFSLDQMASLEPDLGNGFDCSSLIAWSYAKGASLYVGDWTGAQWELGAAAPGATRGKGPAQGGAEPPGGYLAGDLIFFNDTDHVALALGNDLFVHAPRTGDVVRIARLSTYSQVWGWVRYSQVSGIGEAPDEGRLFAIVTDPTGGADLPEDEGIVLFSR